METEKLNSSVREAVNKSFISSLREEADKGRTQTKKDVCTSMRSQLVHYTKEED